jgi:hypothetical protein
LSGAAVFIDAVASYPQSDGRFAFVIMMLASLKTCIVLGAGAALAMSAMGTVMEGSARRLRIAGFMLALYALFAFVEPTLLTLIETGARPRGERILCIRIGGVTVIAAAASAALFAAARTVAKGADAKRELERFI